MKNPPKFDIKLSFTGRSLKGNKKHIDNSLLLEKLLLNKKINIHLKINLDKLEHQYNKKKLLDSKYKIEDESEEEEEEIINNLYTNDSKELLSERKDKIIPKIKLEYSQMNYLRNQTIHKNSRSLSNQNMKISKFKNSTLVLDLDETLVYVTDIKNNFFGLPQIQFEYYIFDESEKFIKENCNKLGIHKLKKSISYLTIRPGFKKFINEVKKYYEEIIVFTSSQYSYAEEIIKIIDKNKIISKIYSRKDCSFFDDVFYKDLNKINEDLSHTIIIDNYPESYLLQHFNGLPIPSFTGNPKDNELLKLIPLLERLSKVKDVRNYIRQINLFNEQNINYNKAYQLLNIKRENFFRPINNNLIRNKNRKNNYMSNLNSNINIRVNKNLRTYNFLPNNSVKIVDDQILKNDPNDYYYIEKGKSQKIIGNEIYPKISNNSVSSNYTNSHYKNIKVKKKIMANRLNHTKNLRKDKNFKLLKPKVIKSVTLNNTKNNSKNDLFEDNTSVIEKSNKYSQNLRDIQNFSGKTINSSLNNTENAFSNNRQKYSSINEFINNYFSGSKTINLDKSNINDNKKSNNRICCKFQKVPSIFTNSEKEIKNININNVSKKSVNGKTNLVSSNSSEQNHLNIFLSQKLVNNNSDILENNNTKAKTKKYEKDQKNSLRRQLVLFHYQNGHLSP